MVNLGPGNSLRVMPIPLNLVAAVFRHVGFKASEQDSKASGLRKRHFTHYFAVHGTITLPLEPEIGANFSMACRMPEA